MILHTCNWQNGMGSKNGNARKIIKSREKRNICMWIQIPHPHKRIFFVCRFKKAHMNKKMGNQECIHERFVYSSYSWVPFGCILYIRYTLPPRIPIKHIAIAHFICVPVYVELFISFFFSLYSVAVHVKVNNGTSCMKGYIYQPTRILFEKREKSK